MHLDHNAHVEDYDDYDHHDFDICYLMISLCKYKNWFTAMLLLDYLVRVDHKAEAEDDNVNIIMMTIIQGHRLPAGGPLHYKLRSIKRGKFRLANFANSALGLVTLSFTPLALGRSGRESPIWKFIQIFGHEQDEEMRSWMFHMAPQA